VHPIHSDDIDTLNEGVHIAEDRMNAFQFTNAFRGDRIVAVFAQHGSNTISVDFNGIAAGVSLDSFSGLQINTYEIDNIHISREKK
jgi:hypothetical protein